MADAMKEVSGFCHRLRLGRSGPARTIVGVRLLALLVLAASCSPTRATEAESIETRENLIQLRSYDESDTGDVLVYYWSLPTGDSCTVRISEGGPLPGWRLWVGGPEEPWSKGYDRFGEQGRYTQEEFLSVLDRSIKRFRENRAGAKIVDVWVEYHQIRELWEEVSAGLRDHFSSMTGTVKDDSIEVVQLLLELVSRSQCVEELIALIGRHDLHVVEFGQLHDHLFFDHSVEGWAWKDLCSLPDLGIMDHIGLSIGVDDRSSK
jgi:hypothetical protein